MDRDGTAETRKSGTALIALEPPRSRLHAAARAGSTVASPQFISQLLASRAHLPVQRQLLRADPGEAGSAYAEARQRGIRRLPAGSYSTRVV